jgi:hypothetical protein
VVHTCGPSAALSRGSSPPPDTRLIHQIKDPSTELTVEGACVREEVPRLTGHMERSAPGARALTRTTTAQTGRTRDHLGRHHLGELRGGAEDLSGCRHGDGVPGHQIGDVTSLAIASLPASNCLGSSTPGASRTTTLTRSSSFRTLPERSLVRMNHMARSRIGATFHFLRETFYIESETYSQSMQDQFDIIQWLTESTELSGVPLMVEDEQALQTIAGLA